MIAKLKKKMLKQLALLVLSGSRTPRIGSFATAELLMGLERIGFFDKYTKLGQKFSAGDIAKELGVRTDLLFASFAFLAEENILEKIGPDTFRLSIDFYQDIAPPLNWSLAYKDIYDSIAELLNGTKIYGRDVVRDATRLGYDSRLGIPLFVRLLKKSGIKRVADIGCGTANFLLALAESIPGFRGFGIDIDKPTVALAKKRIKLSSYKNSIIVLEGDAGHPESFPGEMKTVDAFYAVGVLHEFNKNSRLIPLLRKYKIQFPRSKFFLLESDTPGWDELLKKPDSPHRQMAAHNLLTHYFTEQGLPQSKDQWLKTLKEAGWRVRSVYNLPFGILAFECE